MTISDGRDWAEPAAGSAPGHFSRRRRQAGMVRHVRQQGLNIMQNTGIGALALGLLATFGLVSFEAAAADGPGGAILRAQTQAVTQAVGTQLKAATRPVAVTPVEPHSATALQTARMRAEPSVSSPVQGRVEAGAPVTVTGTVAGSRWLQVTSGQQTGYVWAPLLNEGGR